MGDEIYLPLIEDMVWSYSRITTFEDCPYRFYMKYLHEPHMHEAPMFYSSFGTFMHKILEMYYKGEISKDEMLTKFMTGFSDNVQGVRPKESTVQKYIEGGISYLESFTPLPYEVVDVELRLEFDIDGIPFVGIIDYLGRDGGVLVVVDNKSRDLKPRGKRKKPTKKDEELDLMLRQLYVYSCGVEQRYGKLPTKLCFNCFRTGVFIEEPFDMDAYHASIQWVKKEIDVIKRTTDFYPNMDFFSCNYICGLRDECVYDEMLRESFKSGNRYY